ncbi:hypothetical protein DMB95_00140 [Campylobacter sp. MIT 12-8780]|uniref:hypothetical protein n=1 Tax=unclassified Campylobacter TaxID=2593542 RepID=UPI00115D6584|nr:MULTISPECIES: hypothetical protein [unclassified Campylobacter]NDJ26368.1 hypothetical protein [Campylobacter sp. MIT 19-121]TQR42945.1 hypothetical protein DMB95_00140 [Campylobacter sp. MIT 12-8780]
MGLFSGAFGKWKKKRDRYHRQRMADYERIATKYALDFKLEYATYEHISYEWATAKAKAERGFFAVALSGGNLLKNLLFISVAILGVVLSPVTGGASLVATISMYASITASAVAIAVSMYGDYLASVAVNISIESSRYANANKALERQKLASEQKERLTELIIYGGYEIYANGSIYQKNAAGSQSFSSTIAFDTSKGLRGDLKNDVFDESIHSRVGASKAGGMRFKSDVLGLEFPLSDFKMSARSMIDSFENQLKDTAKRISEGFKELELLDINYTAEGEALFKRVYERQTKPIEQRICMQDFLEKLKAYNKNQRFDFNFITLKSFKKAEKTRSQEELQAWYDAHSYKALQESKTISVELKARYYLDMIDVHLNAIANTLEKSKFYSIQEQNEVKNEHIIPSNEYGVDDTRYVFRGVKSELKLVLMQSDQSLFTYSRFEEKDMQNKYYYLKKLPHSALLLEDFFKLFKDEDTQKPLNANELVQEYEALMKHFARFELSSKASGFYRYFGNKFALHSFYEYALKEDVFFLDFSQTGVIKLRFIALEKEDFKALSEPLFKSEDLKGFDYTTLDAQS